MEQHGGVCDVLKAIYERRSVRNYTGEPVKREIILEALKAASWAPSGLNNQLLKFLLSRLLYTTMVTVKIENLLVLWLSS